MLRGIAAVGAGLLFAMAWRMGLAIKEKLILAFAVHRSKHCFNGWPMPSVMIVGLLPLVVSPYWRLGRK